MKIKLTESQFRRVILKEQEGPFKYTWDDVTTSDPTPDQIKYSNEGKGLFNLFGPIEELNIVQPGTDSIEKGLVYIGKALGIVDIMVRGGFQQVKKDIEELVKEGKLNFEKPLKKLMIGTHGGYASMGCGPFTFDVNDEKGANSYNFLRYLSQFLNKNTKVFFTGCYSGSDPIFLIKIANALGVEKVTASTGKYFPAINKVIDGSFITCEARDIEWWERARFPGQGISAERSRKGLKEKLKLVGCTLSNSNPYGSLV
jgi:hypothetical protein